MEKEKIEKRMQEIKEENDEINSLLIQNEKQRNELINNAIINNGRILELEKIIQEDKLQFGGKNGNNKSGK